MPLVAGSPSYPSFVVMKQFDVTVLETPVHSRQSSFEPVESSQPARFQRSWGEAIVLESTTVPLVEPQNMMLPLQSFTPPSGFAQLSAITLR